jgi:uncharacterized protein YqfA (UPF0365 family)
MIKKTLYDDLLSYKISADDIKTITDTIIFAQENDIKINLNDIISLHFKKIDINKLFKILQNAVENNVKPDMPEFIKLERGKDEFINHLSGWVYSKIKNIDTSIEELKIFAESKINIVNLIDNYTELFKIDQTLSIADFSKCKFCLYRQDKFFSILKKLKKADNNISLKQILTTRLQTNDLEEIYILFRKASNLKNNLSLHQLSELKSKNFNIKEIVEALIIAEDQKLNISPETIFSIANKGFNIKEIVISSFKNETYILKPVAVILKSNIEILLKISILTKADIENFTSGISKDFMNLKIIELFKSEFGKFKSINEIHPKLSEISDNVNTKINKLKTAYKVIGITIQDIDYGRNLSDEFELKNLELKRKIVEEQARISENILKLKNTHNAKTEITEEH